MNEFNTCKFKHSIDQGWSISSLSSLVYSLRQMIKISQGPIAATLQKKISIYVKWTVLSLILTFAYKAFRYMNIDYSSPRVRNDEKKRIKFITELNYKLSHKVIFFTCKKSTFYRNLRDSRQRLIFPCDFFLLLMESNWWLMLLGFFVFLGQLQSKSRQFTYTDSKWWWWSLNIISWFPNYQNRHQNSEENPGLGGIKKETPCIYSFCTAVGIGKNTSSAVLPVALQEQRLL